MERGSGAEARNETQSETIRQLRNFVSIGIALSAERDRDRLLEMIITEARRITGAEAGTLYLVEGDHLRVKLIHNERFGIFQGHPGTAVDLPPVPLDPAYVSGYVALHGEPVNIADVYSAQDQFDFSGPRRYDSLTGYHTQSMLVIPLKDHSQAVIGVLQLLNAISAEGVVGPFDTSHEAVTSALASLAAIALTNQQLIREIEGLFESFVQVMVTAIDERTPYNATHTQQVSRLARLLAETVNAAADGPFAQEEFDEDRLKQVVTAAWLHDIGKIATPLEVMNKATRLGALYPLVMQRVACAFQAERAASLSRQVELWRAGRGDEAEAEAERLGERLVALAEARDLIRRADDPATFIDDQLRLELQQVAQLSYREGDSLPAPLLTPEELTCLSVPRGTLTAAERQVMEEHVLVTDRMLAKLAFTRSLQPVRRLACLHHEYLDGRGYPYGLRGDELPLEARILVLADIFDALTATDRPYKKGMPPEKALEILGGMAREGKLDADLLRLFAAERVWERDSRPAAAVSE